MSLTDKDLAKIEFMREFLSENDRLPTQREICERYGWKSLNAANEFMIKLMRYGVVERSGKMYYRFKRNNQQKGK